MNVAERLFAERGIDAVSLRTINTEAGYSVAALHYHFGSRDALVHALLERAQPPMLQAREPLMLQLAAQQRPRVREIAAALVMPLTAGMEQDFAASIARLRFLVRLSFDRSPYLAQIVARSQEQFQPLLQRALPQLDAATLRHRWLLATDLAQQALANAPAVLAITRRRAPDPGQLQQFVEELIGFIAAGLAGVQ